MSVGRTGFVTCRWNHPAMIPWYRQLLSLIFGVGVMTIAIWAIYQGNGMVLIAGVAGMSFVTLLLIFGVEIDYIEIGGNRIEFTSTSRDTDNDDD